MLLFGIGGAAAVKWPLISFLNRDGHGSSGVLVRVTDVAEAREKFIDCNPDVKIENVRRMA